MFVFVAVLSETPLEIDSSRGGIRQYTHTHAHIRVDMLQKVSTLVESVRLAHPRVAIGGRANVPAWVC